MAPMSASKIAKVLWKIYDQVGTEEFTSGQVNVHGPVMGRLADSSLNPVDVIRIDGGSQGRQIYKITLEGVELLKEYGYIGG